METVPGNVGAVGLFAARPSGMSAAYGPSPVLADWCSAGSPGSCPAGTDLVDYFLLDGPGAPVSPSVPIGPWVMFALI